MRTFFISGRESTIDNGEINQNQRSIRSLLDFRLSMFSFIQLQLYFQGYRQKLILLKGVLTMSFLYENLDVYKKSIQLADELTEATELFPKGKYYLKDQLNRA